MHLDWVADRKRVKLGSPRSIVRQESHAKEDSPGIEPQQLATVTIYLAS